MNTSKLRQWVAQKFDMTLEQFSAYLNAFLPVVEEEAAPSNTVYLGFLGQSGSAAPLPTTPRINLLDGPVFTRDQAGVYLLTVDTAAFFDLRTRVIFHSDIAQFNVTGSRASNTIVVLQASDLTAAAAPADGCINGWLEIQVLPE